MVSGEYRKLYPVRCAHLIEDVHQMALHRVLADRKTQGDRLVCVARDHRFHDLEFTTGQAERLGPPSSQIETADGRSQIGHAITSNTQLTSHDRLDAVEQHFR